MATAMRSKRPDCLLYSQGAKNLYVYQNKALSVTLEVAEALKSMNK